MGVKTEGGTPALYHIISESAMGATEKRYRKSCMGVKTEGGTAALYHIISESAMGATEKRYRKSCMGDKIEDMEEDCSHQVGVRFDLSDVKKLFETYR